MGKLNVVLALCLLALVASSCVAHKRTNKNRIRPTKVLEDPEACKVRLCTECQEVRDLIPRDTIVDITASHYRSDSRFRRAVRFIYTNEFADVASNIQKTDEYKQLIKLLKNGDVNLGSMDTITGGIDCLVLPIPFHVRQRSVVLDINARQSPALPQSQPELPAHVIEARSLQTYAVELLNSMPRDDFYDLVQRDMDDDTQFGRFYKVLRSDAFHNAIWNALNSDSWADSLKVLRRNNIDVCSLVEQAIKLLSWGPQP